MAGQNSQVKDSLHLAELPVRQMPVGQCGLRGMPPCAVTTDKRIPERIVFFLPLLRKLICGKLNYGMKAVDKWDGGG